MLRKCASASLICTSHFAAYISVTKNEGETMCSQTKKKYSVKLSRGYFKSYRGCRRAAQMKTILATGFAGAVIGGFLSAGVIVPICTAGVASKPALSSVTEQQSSGSLNAPYAPASSSYPVVDVAKKTVPAVVTICNFQSIANPESQPENNDLNNNNLIQMGSGSGFIIDANQGYIVTNYHVIEGAKKLLVCLANGDRVYGTLVGADASTDLAVIKLSSPKNLTAVELGDSSQIQVGEPVVVIGNPYGDELAGSVTTGIVSAVKRNLPDESRFDLIQTDAAINPGNSGGPLLNYRGQVIGINSAKYSQAGVEGIGFAIPITEAMPVIRELIEKGYAG